MQLGDLQNEVIAAQQRPFSRLAGLEDYEITKEHKLFWKKSAKQRLNHAVHGLRKAVSYTIDDDIIDFLRPSVENWAPTWNQRALFNACLNARPRHNNMWIEWNDNIPIGPHSRDTTPTKKRPLKTVSCLTGWHIYTLRSSFQFREGHVNRAYAVEPGECFHFENYYDAGGDYPTVPDHRTIPAELSARHTRWRESNYIQRVGISRLSGSTDLWASQRIFGADGSTYLPAHEDASEKLKRVWFLGDGEREFSPDMQSIMGHRWRIGLNNYVDDIPANNRTVAFSQRTEAYKMAWLTAIMSLMNFDWFVETTQDTGPQGSKPLRGDITPFNSHHTVLLKLPKTKGRVILPRQLQRNVQFGVRRHEVAGHPRHYRDKYGQVYKTIYVRPHERGDAKLGRVTKDYSVVKDDG